MSDVNFLDSKEGRKETRREDSITHIIYTHTHKHMCVDV